MKLETRIAWLQNVCLNIGRMLSEFPKVTLRERKGQAGCPHQGTRGTRIEKVAGRQSLFGPLQCCCVRTFPKHPDASWRLFLTKPPTCTISILCKLYKFAFVRHSLPRFSRMLFMACLCLRMCKSFINCTCMELQMLQI